MQAQRIDPLSAIVPLLRYRALWVLLVAAPGITAAVALLTATESNLALVFVLNVATGVVIFSTVFVAVSLAAREVGNERMNLARATEEGQWRAGATDLHQQRRDRPLRRLVLPPPPFRRRSTGQRATTPTSPCSS